MRRFASIALVSLLAACSANVSVDAPATAKAPTAASVPPSARLVAHDAALGYCGTYYSFCPMFVLGDRVFFRAVTAPDAASPFAASIRSVNTSDDRAETAIVTDTSDASNLFGPFLGGDGIEWLVQSNDATATTTLFTGKGIDVDARELGSIAGTSLVASDDAAAIYLFLSDSTLVRVSKSDGSARVVGALDGFVAIAAVADSDPSGSLYATGLDGIARVSKSNALLTTLSKNEAGTQFGDRLSVGAGQLFAAEETSSTSTILSRALVGGALHTVASSAGGSSSIVVDGDDVYWIAVTPTAGTLVSSALWRAPLAGGTPTQLYGEPSAPSWLTGVAFDATSIYVTTSDGRLLALAK
jgi:hypothetical protein